jgi:hypothetical protein
LKHVVSVSLGSSKGDKVYETRLLGQDFRIERVGVDGQFEAFRKKVLSLDGRVDAIGIGGADLYLVAAGRRYAFRQILQVANKLKKTPIVDGSGLKHTLERKAIHILQEAIDFPKLTTLLVIAVDRFGMAQGLEEVGAKVIYGDLMFSLGLPIPLRSRKSIDRLGALALPIVTQLPFQWFYPTGERQHERKPRFAKIFEEADVIAGDKHVIFRYMPPSLKGKIMITQSVRKADVEELQGKGLKALFTTTPVMGGETFATNVMEAVVVAALEKMPGELSEQEFENALNALGWRPGEIKLSGEPNAL